MRFNRKISVALVALLCMGNLFSGIPASAVSSKATSETSAKDTNSAEASTIRLMGSDGDVTVEDAVGKELAVADKMRLFTGNHVITDRESYAYLNLDDTKAVKLDEVSDAEVRQKGKNLEVLMHSGNMFFDVTEKVPEGQYFSIRTSCMVMGIRGTCGSIEVINSSYIKVDLFGGKLQCVVINPATGDEKTVELNPGETGEFMVTPASEDGEDQGSCEINVSSIDKEKVRGFVLDAIVDGDLADMIYEQSGVDFRGLTREEADKKLREDEAAMKAKLDKIAGEQKKQDDNSKRNDVWNGRKSQNRGNTPSRNILPPAGGTQGDTGQTPDTGGSPITATDNTSEGGDGQFGDEDTGDQSSDDNKDDDKKDDKDDNDDDDDNKDDDDDNKDDDDDSDDDSDDDDDDDDNKEEEETKYSITASATSNGTVSFSTDSAAKGTSVQITVTPDKGYTIDSVKVTDSKGEFEIFSVNMGIL